MCTKFHQNFTDCSGHVWGGLGPFRASKSSNRSKNMGSNAQSVNRGSWIYHRFCLIPIFSKFNTLNVYQISPKFHRLFRTCLRWVGAFWSIKKAQISPKIWVWMHWMHHDYHYVCSNPYFPINMSFFDALKGPNPPQACLEQRVKFWWKLVHN